VRSHSLSMCQRADLRVSRAGVNHLLTDLALIVFVLIGAWVSRRFDRVVCMRQQDRIILVEGAR